MRTRSLIKIFGIVIGIGLLIFLGRMQRGGILQDVAIKIARPLFFVSARIQNFLRLSRPALEEEQKREDRALAARDAAMYDQVRRENGELRALFLFKDKKENALLGAHILLYMREFGKEFLLIDQGERAGVRDGDKAVDAQGFLVGTVRESSKDNAKVAVASNAGETYDIELLPLGARALARGIGGRTFAIELIQSDAPVEAGDFIELFLPESSHPLMAAEVTQAQKEVNSAFQSIFAVLLARPDYLKEVFILRSASE